MSGHTSTCGVSAWRNGGGVHPGPGVWSLWGIDLSSLRLPVLSFFPHRVRSILPSARGGSWSPPSSCFSSSVFLAPPSLHQQQRKQQYTHSDSDTPYSYTHSRYPHTYTSVHTQVFPSRSACTQIFTGPIGTSPSLFHTDIQLRSPLSALKDTQRSSYTPPQKFLVRKFLQFERTLKITAKAAQFTVEVTEARRM